MKHQGEKDMKLKRILNVILACVLFSGTIVVTALAQSTVDWEKTQINYKIPCIDKTLSKSMQKLVMKTILPMLTPALSDTLDLTSGLYNDDFINETLQSLAPGLGTIGTLMSPKRMYIDTASIASEVPQAVKDAIADASPAFTWSTIHVPWGCDGTREDFLRLFALALRPFIGLALRDDICLNYQDIYLPALRALGCAKDTLYDQETLIAAWAAAQNYEPASDNLIKAILEPVFIQLDRLKADPANVLFEMLPNLTYNVDQVNTLKNPPSRPVTAQTGPLLFNALGIEGDDFMAFFESALSDAAAGLGLVIPSVNWDLVAHAGDLEIRTEDYYVVERQNLGGGKFAMVVVEKGEIELAKVVADKDVMYCLLIEGATIVLNSNKDAITAQLPGLLGLPSCLDFLGPALFRLIKSLLWLALI
jgi:hypothetical protein